MSQRRHLIGTFALFFVAGLGAGVLFGLHLARRDRLEAVPVSVTDWTTDAEGRVIPSRIIAQAPDVPHTVLSPVPVPPCGATSTRSVPEK